MPNQPQTTREEHRAGGGIFLVIPYACDCRPYRCGACTARCQHYLGRPRSAL